MKWTQELQSFKSHHHTTGASVSKPPNNKALQVAASHPFLRTKKNTHHQCCTTVLAAPGTAQVFTPHVPSEDWNYRGFSSQLPISMGFRWSAKIYPLLSSVIDIQHFLWEKGRREAASKPSSWITHLQKFHVSRYSRENHSQCTG